MKRITHNQKTVSLKSAIAFLEEQQQKYPGGLPWGNATPDWVRKELQSIALEDRTVPLPSFANLLLSIHRGRNPADANTDANKALQGMIAQATRQSHGTQA